LSYWALIIAICLAGGAHQVLSGLCLNCSAFVMSMEVLYQLQLIVLWREEFCLLNKQWSDYRHAKTVISCICLVLYYV